MTNLTSIWQLTQERAARDFEECEPFTERQVRAIQRLEYSAWYGAVNEVDVSKDVADRCRDGVLSALDSEETAA